MGYLHMPGSVRRPAGRSRRSAVGQVIDKGCHLPRLTETPRLFGWRSSLPGTPAYWAGCGAGPLAGPLYGLAGVESRPIPGPGAAPGAGSTFSAHSGGSSRPKGHMAEPSSSRSPLLSRKGTAFAVLGLAASLFSAMPPLAAQGVTGAAIEGRVVDRDSTPLEQAIVHVINTSNGERWQTATSARGRYFIEYLTVGGP